MTKLRTELFSVAAAERAIKDNLPAEEERFAANEIFEFYSGDDKINKRYSHVTRIRAGLSSGRIKKDTEAKRLLKVHISMVVNYMVKRGMVDMNIVQNENINLDELVTLYHEHKTRTEFIVDVLNEFSFIRDHIEALAANGKPYTTKNAEKIEEYKKKQSELPDSWNPKVKRRLLYQSYEQQIEQLGRNDKIGIKFYPIENLCYLLIHKKEGFEYKKERDPYHHNSIRAFSPTSQERLLKLIVQQYRAHYKTEIQEYRDKRNKEKKNLKRRTKSTTPDEKRKVIQKLKHSGFSQKFVIKTMGCSPRTVKTYW